MLLKHVGSTRDGAGPVVAMLHYFPPCTRHDKAGGGGNVESVFAVASRPYDVDGVGVAKVDGHPAHQYGVAESRQLLGSDASHKKYGHECRQLVVVVFSVGYI